MLALSALQDSTNPLGLILGDSNETRGNEGMDQPSNIDPFTLPNGFSWDALPDLNTLLPG